MFEEAHPITIALWILIVIAALFVILSRVFLKWQIVKSKKYNKGQLFMGRAYLGQIIGYDSPVTNEPVYLRLLRAVQITTVILLVLIVVLALYRYVIA